MKFKNIIVIVGIILIVFIIYLTTIDKKIYYLDLNVNNYQYSNKIKQYINKRNKLERFVTGFVDIDSRTTDLIRNIEDNKTIKIKNNNQTIKNALIKADLLTLTIGLNELNYKINTSTKKELYEYSDSLIKDINKLLKIIREYCKEDIIFIGLSNSYGSKYDDIFKYVNNKIGELCYDYKIYFINPDSLNNSRDSKSTNQKIIYEIEKIIKTKIID